MRVRERTLQAPQWATRKGCSPRAEKLIRADTTLDHSQKAERADKLIRPDTALDHTQKAESALSLYYGYYATTTLPEGARQVATTRHTQATPQQALTTEATSHPRRPWQALTTRALPRATVARRLHPPRDKPELIY